MPNRIGTGAFMEARSGGRWPRAPLPALALARSSLPPPRGTRCAGFFYVSRVRIPLAFAALLCVSAAFAKAPIPDIRDSYGVAVADFDRDGLLDVYIVGFRTLNRLLINDGDGTFHDK